MFRHTDVYRRAIKSEDYFLNLSLEIKALDQPRHVQHDFKVLTSESETEEQKCQIWEKKAEHDGRLLEKHAR